MTDKSELTDTETKLLELLDSIRLMLFMIAVMLALIAGSSFAH